jgi:DNA-directed RNA polymerase specialized sigma24 family protein
MENRNDQVEAWYIANATKIKKWANKRSKQDAEDILQDTAINLLRNKASWESISKKKHTRWTMFEYYKGYQDMDEIEDTPVEFNIEAQIYAKKSVELISQLLDTVSDKKAAYTGNNTGNTLLKIHREIFIMRFFQEMGYEEIADKLGMSHGTVRQLGSRAAKIIKEKFNNIIGE